MTDDIRENPLPLPPEIVAIGEAATHQIVDILKEVWDAVMAVKEGPNDAPRHNRDNDALSVLSQIAAVASAKFMMMMTFARPDATPLEIWTVCQTDLQLRARDIMRQFQIDMMGKGETKQ